jgi:hypothetical protein
MQQAVQQSANHGCLVFFPVGQESVSTGKRRIPERSRCPSIEGTHDGAYRGGCLRLTPGLNCVHMTADDAGGGIGCAR